MITTQQSRLDLINLMHSKAQAITHVASDDANIATILDDLYNSGEHVRFVSSTTYQYVAYITPSRAVKVALQELW